MTIKLPLTSQRLLTNSNPMQRKKNPIISLQTSKSLAVGSTIESTQQKP